MKMLRKLVKLHVSLSVMPITTTLNTFIRENAKLKGTKFMCLEGGCGACIVTVTVPDPVTGRNKTFAVNSCLVPIYLCHGWSITTIEHLGNRCNGYDNIQTRLAGKNGSQCGYCTPGMVMNMYSLLQAKKSEENADAKLMMKEIEDSFGGNICRCTGYRSILDAFKSFGSDAPKSLVEQCADIEEIYKSCSKSCKEMNPDCSYKNYRDEFIELSFAANNLKISVGDGTEWYTVTSKSEIFQIFDGIDDKSYMLINGNTAQGVYHLTKTPDVYIDVRNVPELHSHNMVDNCLQLGANIFLTDTIEVFYEVAKKHTDYFEYLEVLAEHIKKIAHVPVRNIGSIAGNLSIKHQHNEFPSDIFTTFEAAGAQVTVEDTSGIVNTISLLEYLQTDITKKIISSVILPPWNNEAYTFVTYKIMPRAQNAHAYVNAGFLFKIDKANKCKVLEKPNIVFGGIRPDFIHATETEKAADGKQLLDPKQLKGIMKILCSELNPDHILPDASPKYRKGLAMSLFYKFILSLVPEKIDQKLRSGGEELCRPLSSGQQDYESHRLSWPLHEPAQKLEALVQCSGEAEFVNDICGRDNELFGAVVLADRAIAASFTIDAKEALAIPGVFAMYTAKDIPGVNNFMNANKYPFVFDPVMANRIILYAGQPVCIILAITQDLARLAARKVKVQYRGVIKPKIDFLDVIKAKDRERVREAAKILPIRVKQNSRFIINGTFTVRGQYHYTMETQTCFCVPVEDGMDVYPSSQWPTFIQETISKVLNMPQNKINVSVKRLGGGYGAKISRNNQVAAMCALAAHLSCRPVHLTLDMETNMQMCGKRFPCHTEYEVGVDGEGRIQYLIAQLYQDSGLVPNELLINVTLSHFKNIYDTTTWNVTGFIILTDNPSNTWCRAPNSTEGLASIENIMEHIAKVVGKDPVSVKLANLLQSKNEVIPTMIKSIQDSSDYSNRLAAIKEYNKNNRWKKRGMSLLPMNYNFEYMLQFHALVCIYGNDGTVAITHGGIEMGQGINTKIAQVCAYLFGIPLSDVTVKQTMSITSPNDETSGGSITSEAVAFAVSNACKILLERLGPIKKNLPKATWKQVIKAAYLQQIDLSCSYMYKKQEPLQDYAIYGVAVTEVIVDILTGQHQIVRVDLLEDAGKSLNPNIDIGQLEGAFVMGLGYYTSEELIYDKDTGKLLTDRTWTYKPLGAKDIPIDFRIQLLKNSDNPYGVYGSKATGEPPLNLSVTVICAIRNALESARKDAGSKEDWFKLENPLTCERIWLNGMTKSCDFTV